MVEAVDLAWRRGLKPEPQITVSEWADRHRMLPRTAAEPGRWRTERAPYLGEIMDCLSAGSTVERVVFMKGVQIGGTEAGLNWLGYIIAHAPGLALLVMPTTDTAKRNTGVRIDPLIEDCPILRELVVVPRSKDSGNSLFRKKFPGGELVMTGANSAAGLRSTPARFLMLDEVDAYPGDADEEGDPVELAIKRTVTFRGRRKIYLVSTPTLAGYSRIEAAYLESDQRIFEVPCPDCGAFSAIEWSQIQWPDARRADAFRACPSCGAVHHEHQKPALLAAGRWRATSRGDGRTAGFHLSALYSPWMTWGECALEHAAAGRDPARLKTWTNTVLAQCWQEEQGEGLDADALTARRETLDLLPPGAVTLTAGIDVQPDRIEAQVVAWGAGEESWIICHTVLPGDPSGPAVWIDLERELARRYAHSLNLPDMPVRAACIDTGGANTLSVYAWVRGQRGRNVWAIKGASQAGRPLWPRRPTRTNKGKIPLYLLNVDAGKEALYARLKLTVPGTGFVHLNADLPLGFEAGLTAEKVATRYVKGRPKREWCLPSGVRNEPLDAFVYALAALHGLKSMGLNLDQDAMFQIGNACMKPQHDGAIAPPQLPPRPTVVRSRYLGG